MNSVLFAYAMVWVLDSVFDGLAVGLGVVGFGVTGLNGRFVGYFVGRNVGLVVSLNKTRSSKCEPFVKYKVVACVKLACL